MSQDRLEEQQKRDYFNNCLQDNRKKILHGTSRRGENNKTSEEYSKGRSDYERIPREEK